MGPQMLIHGLLVTLHFITDIADELGVRQFCDPLLFKNIIDLAVLEAEVVEQVLPPGEHGAAGAAQLALEGRHTLRELRRQVLHEVVAVVLLQVVPGLQGLVAHLTLQPRVPGHGMSGRWRAGPGPNSPFIRDSPWRWNWMAAFISVQNKSLDITFGLNKRGLFLIFSVTVWDNKMVYNIST